MRKFAKPILFVAGAILVALVVFVLAINLYLQSKGVQDRIRSAATQSAGVPVEIQGTCYIPWRGLVVSGVVVPHSGAIQVPMLNVASVSIRFETFGLLKGQFNVTEVLIENPVLLAFQRSDGSWSTPESAPTQPSKSSSTAEPPPADALEVSPQGVEPPTPSVTPQAPRLSVQKVRIRNGKILVDDLRGRRIGEIEGIEVVVTPSADGSLAGTFAVGSIILLGKLALKNTNGSFLATKDYFEIPSLQSNWADGTIQGRFGLSSRDESRFSASLEAENVSLKTLATDAGLDAEGTKGNLIGSGEIAGLVGQPQTLVGQAKVELKSARIQPVEFIRQIGELMAIEELQMLELKSAFAEFAIANEQVIAKNILMESKNLVIDASGPIGFNGKLDLDANLHVNDRLHRDLRALLGKNLAGSPREGYKLLPFSIGGTVNEPESDLLDKIAGVKLGRDVGNVLQNLLQFSVPKKQKRAAPPSEATPGGQ